MRLVFMEDAATEALNEFRAIPPRTPEEEDEGYMMPARSPEEEEGYAQDLLRMLDTHLEDTINDIDSAIAGVEHGEREGEYYSQPFHSPEACATLTKTDETVKGWRAALVNDLGWKKPGYTARPVTAAPETTQLEDDQRWYDEFVGKVYSALRYYHEDAKSTLEGQYLEDGEEPLPPLEDPELIAKTKQRLELLARTLAEWHALTLSTEPSKPLEPMEPAKTDASSVIE